MRRLNDPAERLAGDVHVLSGLFLIQTLEVGQANRLQLINRQGDVL
jgi:hypothetical protein